MNLDMVMDFQNKVHKNISKVILGKSEIIDLTIMAAVCQGHILIEDVPGTGKTMLAKCLSRSLNAEFSRIQFTPDMLPSDVTGLSIYNQSTKDFEFRPGPIFANIILADEINRAAPKTQSALLEAMEEKQVTIDGLSNCLPEFFMVLATQNPIDFEGTFNLPEAQLDRFIMRLRIGYPNFEAETEMLQFQRISHPYEKLTPVADVIEMMNVQNEIKNVHISPKIEKYILDIISLTRDNEELYLGASPRASLALYRLGQCYAAFHHREYVVPDDIKKIAPYVIAHRIIPAPSTSIIDFNPEDFIRDLILKIPVPGG